MATCAVFEPVVLVCVTWLRCFAFNVCPDWEIVSEIWALFETSVED
jgi:hypothetical protein